MNYQARMGMMCAGSYRLPQFRMRSLPQFPLPAHDVVFKGQILRIWEQSMVAYNEGHNQQLRRKLLPEDALSDLPETLWAFMVRMQDFKGFLIPVR